MGLALSRVDVRDDDDRGIPSADAPELLVAAHVQVSPACVPANIGRRLFFLASPLHNWSRLELQKAH